MDNQQHLLRVHYSNLFGSDSITESKKVWFTKSDWIPIAVILLIFAWFTFSSGYIEPKNKLQKLNDSIEKTSTYFDDRAKRSVKLVDSIRQKLSVNELEGLKLPNTNGKRILALDLLTGIENNISRLTLQKPNNDVIEARLNAAIEFAELSKKIVKQRDLDQYVLNKRPEKKEESKLSWDNFEFPDFDADAIHNNQAQEVTALGKKSIEKAEEFLDELNEPEKKAKELLSEFEGLSLPRREHELLKRIHSEWNKQYEALLNQWKNLRSVEIKVDAVLASKLEKEKKLEVRRAELEKLKSEKAALEQRLNNQSTKQQVEPKQVETIQNKKPKAQKKEVRQTNKSQPVKQQTRQKSSRTLREEKKRKALDLLK